MRFFLFCWIIFSVSQTLWASYSPTLEWEASQDPGVAGYKVYWNTKPRSETSYPNVIDAGNVTRQQIPNLEEGVFYYFAATAYDTQGIESDFSEEIKFYSPIRLWLSREGVLKTYLAVGGTYVLERSYNLSDWQGVTTITPERNEVLFPIEFSEPYSFYRILKLPQEVQQAVRMALRSMTTTITPPKKVKLTFWQKVRNAFRYHPERNLHPRDTKGSPYVWAGSNLRGSRDPILELPAPPMPPVLKKKWRRFPRYDKAGAAMGLK